MSDNELIAEFMGHEFEASSGKWCMQIRGLPKGCWLYGKTSDEFDYDANWSWLMPVVEKIAKIETNDVIHNGEDSYFDSYFPRTFGMINSETKEFMVRINRNPLHQSTSLIEATYKAVVEFIKWHKEQKP